MGRTLPIVLAAYNDTMVQAAASDLRPFLVPGDEVDLVTGNHSNPLSIPSLERWTRQLAGRLPEGVRFLAHTSGLGNAGKIASDAPPAIGSILLDYEPNWDPEFTWDFAGTLQHLDQFASNCRAHGRRAVAYPTGRPLLEGPLQGYGWDYAGMLGHVDEVYPQTQHWATLGSDRWAAALGKLRSQWSARGLDPGRRVVQLTVGDRENGVLAPVASERCREAIQDGIQRLFVWWSPAVMGELVSFLSALDR
ncbi:MAG: hypothetical protein L3K10_01400 [Thermoplasmata archaeon]|nr:hypothetical protein [Thermoplasmata archaeon]